MIRRVADRLRAPHPPSGPVVSTGSWDALVGAHVVALCHPDWRGVRTAAYTHRVPVIEVADAGAHAQDLVERLVAAAVRVLVVQGWPPGSRDLVRAASARGVATRCILHSSMAQHGGEAGEAAVADEVLALAREGVIGRVGFVKEGLAEAFAALGFPAHWVPNRMPDVPPSEPLDLGPGLHVGVFAEPFWRKNVVTQLGAVALMEGATAHVLRPPHVRYLDGLHVVEHGVLPWSQFVRLQASVHLNLYVTLSECYPLSPIESYAAGVPCLMSRTSAVFRDDPELWDLTTVGEADNPRATGEAARQLLHRRDYAVRAAQRWIGLADGRAAASWDEFAGTET